MRRAVLALLVMLASASVTPARQAVPPQPDSVTSVLNALQAAIAGEDVAAFRALLAPTLAPADRVGFEVTVMAGGVTNATLRERDRESRDGGSRSLAEILVERGGAGQIATWLITMGAPASPGARPAITALKQVSSIDGLHRLELDTSHAFDVRNFTFTATDFRLTMDTGTAFVARADGGVTAMVLRGHGRMQFEPSDPIERHQIERYAKTPTLNEPVDAAFIRINPSEYDARVAEGSLVPATAASRDISRAKAIFSQWVGRSYSLTLGDLSPDRWSLLPNFGDALADLSTSRHGWLTYGRAGGQSEDVSLFDRLNKKNISIYASPAKLATRGRFYSEDDERTFDIEHYDMNVRFDPAHDGIAGVATLRLKLLRHDTGTITLKLAEPLAVTSLTSANWGRLLHLRVTGQDSVLVSFPELEPAGTVVTLTVEYAGRLAPQSLSREAAAVQGQVTTNAADPIPPEPNYAYSVNSYWYPQGTVTDYATSTMRVTVPQEYQNVSTGTLTSEEVIGPDRTARFVADVPVRYLSTVTSRLVQVPKSSVALPGGGTLTIDARSNPRQLGNTRTLAQRAADIMKFYASIVGDVPYPSFTLLSLEAEVPGGHSPAYFAAINQPTPTTILSWRADPIAFDDQFPNFFLAHEIAHQWWGQAVGTKNYHEQWLSEGLAQYFAYLYAGQDRGPGVQRNILERMRASVRKFDDSGPISLGYRLGHVVGNGTNYRSIVYNKSTIVLDMLRQLIGDRAFTAGLRRFYREMRNGKAGVDDLRAAFEAESKDSLGRFFDRWVLGSGLPQLKLTSAVETDGSAALLRIEQSGDVFDVPVTVVVSYEKDPTEFVTVNLRAAVTTLRVPLKGAVRPGGIRLIAPL